MAILWIQAIIAVVISAALVVALVLGIYATYHVNLPADIVHLNDTGNVTGRLPMWRVEPGTFGIGCAFSNGTHLFIGDCANGMGPTNLTNGSLFTGRLSVSYGGTGTVTFGAGGILKSTGGTTELFVESNISLVTEVTDILGPDHGGLGTNALGAGFLRSTGAGQTIVSTAKVNLLDDVLYVLQPEHGGSGAPTFTAGFLRSPGGSVPFTTTTVINVTNETTGVLPSVHGGLGHPSFGAGYIYATGANDFVATLPIPTAHLAAVLDGKTLTGVTLLPDATEDALLYVSSGGFLSGVRYVFEPADFTVGSAGTNPVTLTVSLNQLGDVTNVTHGGTGLTSLAAGSLIYGSGTSTVSTLAAEVTGNVLLSGTAPMWGKVTLTTHVSGILPAANGGTGFGTAVPYAVGDILYASTTTTLAACPASAAGNVLLSGTTPTWGKVSLTAHIDTATILPAANGGTGFGTATPYSVGDILYASAATTLSNLPAGGTNKVLLSSATVPSWGKVSLTAHIDTATVLLAVNGGTGINTYSAGDILYGNGINTLGKLAASMPGRLLHTNGAGLAPYWDPVILTQDVGGVLPAPNGGTGFGTTVPYAVGDILYASTTTTLAARPAAAAGNVLLSGTTPTWGKVSLTAHIDTATVLPVANGGTDISSYTVGAILHATAAGVIGQLVDVATGNVIISGGVGAIASYGKVGLTTHVSGVLPVANGGTNIPSYTVGAILYASAAGVVNQLVDVAVGSVLISGGLTTAPAYGKVSLTAHIDTATVLPKLNGGTGQSSYTDGQLLIGVTTGNTLAKGTLTAGQGISVTNGAGAITLASTYEHHVMREQQTAGTNGGTAASAAFATRTLTHLASSPGATSLTGFASNEFTLAAGTYMIRAWSSAYRSVAYTARVALYQASGGAMVYGATCVGAAGEAINPTLTTLLTTGAQAIVLKMSISTFGAVTDLGKPASDGIIEQYTFIEVIKVA